MSAHFQTESAANPLDMVEQIAAREQPDNRTD